MGWRSLGLLAVCEGDVSVCKAGEEMLTGEGPAEGTSEHF